MIRALGSRDERSRLLYSKSSKSYEKSARSSLAVTTSDLVSSVAYFQ